jgi:Raf kinase inhibitor-like YbhB/YbcL family protein
MALTLRSSAFAPNQPIPVRYTGDGEDLSPPLTWSGVPPGTKSLALVVDDPDAPDPKHPRQAWVHWLVYNLPPDCAALTEDAALPPGARLGRNDWQRSDYGGPAPPVGRHRYFHKLYALDTLLPDLKQPNKAQLERAMHGHVLAQAELVGTYER